MTKKNNTLTILVGDNFKIKMNKEYGYDLLKRRGKVYRHVAFRPRLEQIILDTFEELKKQKLRGVKGQPEEVLSQMYLSDQEAKKEVLQAVRKLKKVCRGV